jgi:hypothetical protein
MAEIKKIVVTGDVTVDWLMRRVKAQDPVDEQGKARLNWELFCGTRMTARAGGALLLVRLIQEGGKFQVLAPRLRNLKDVQPHKVLHSMVLLERFPYSPDSEDTKIKGKKFSG